MNEYEIRISQSSIAECWEVELYQTDPTSTQKKLVGRVYAAFAWSARRKGLKMIRDHRRGIRWI